MMSENYYLILAGGVGAAKLIEGIDNYVEQDYADAVMIGSIFAQAEEAPGHGYHWGMATPHAALPRGTRIKVGTTGTLEQILFGPTSTTHGTQNLVGALRTAMGVCGAAEIPAMHKAEMVIAPSIVTEGKYWQLRGSC